MSGTGSPLLSMMILLYDRLLSWKTGNESCLALCYICKQVLGECFSIVRPGLLYMLLMFVMRYDSG